MMRITGRRTVPQIYIGDRHVGGFDDSPRWMPAATGPAAGA